MKNEPSTVVIEGGGRITHTASWGSLVIDEKGLHVSTDKGFEFTLSNKGMDVHRMSVECATVNTRIEK